MNEQEIWCVKLEIKPQKKKNCGLPSGGWDGCHHLIDLGIGGRILLKRILEKKGKCVRYFCIGFSRLGASSSC